MSVSTISANYGYSQIGSYQTSGNRNQHKNEMDALGEALQSGDLSAAQQVFSQMQQHAPGGAQQCGSSGTSGDAVITEISALGQALAASDLSSAQSAFSALQSDFENAPPPPSSANNGGVDFESLLEQLSSALESGDLTAAQDAFSSLQDDVQNAPPPPPPGGPGGPGGTQGGNDQVAQAFDDLSTALENGDLEAAQTAFETLQSLAPDNQDSSSSTANASSTDTISTDMAALQEALQNGDLDSAQSLFETLLADLQANAPRHPGMHSYTQNDASTTTSNSVSTSA
ncbi:MAG: hypothetical protein QM709_09260 [Spongiibacteraceae bacterium]